MPSKGGKVDASQLAEAIREVRVTRGCFPSLGVGVGRCWL